MAVIELLTVLPNIASGLANTGFLFGAGTSVEAGYPMMPELTREIMKALLERTIPEFAGPGMRTSGGHPTASRPQQ